MNGGQENHDLPFPLLRCIVTLGIQYSVEARLSRWESFEALFRWLARRGGRSHTAVADACVNLTFGSRMPWVMRRGDSRTDTALVDISARVGFAAWATSRWRLFKVTMPDLDLAGEIVSQYVLGDNQA